MNDNIILLVDSYKVGHHVMYPPGTQLVRSYMESRGGMFPDVTFFGLQYYMHRYLEGQVVTEEKIQEAKALYRDHFGTETIFNERGWRYVLEKYQGRLPIRIRAVPEGTVVPTLNVLMVVENTDPACFWLTNYIETMLLKVWYPTTVCTLSRNTRALILKYLEETGDPGLIDFKLHDFGARGTSSEETAALGGASHLINFKGTDTVSSICLLQKYYAAIEMPGFSIPAAEHSTITSWGYDQEEDAYRNILQQFPRGLVAVVSDSYDIEYACNGLWGERLKEEVLSRDGTLVVRPDSGDPVSTVSEVIEILGEKFGSTKNDKGYKVLNPKVRIIQGDGVDFHSIKTVLDKLRYLGWSTDNIAFGMGGALLQKVDRDTQKFAFKACQIRVNDTERDVYKLSYGKQSKGGNLALVFRDGSYRTVAKSKDESAMDDLLEVVFENGMVTRRHAFHEIAARARGLRH